MLNAATANDYAAQAANVPVTRPSGSQKVVIVNGSPEILDLLDSVLEAGHYNVVFVESNEHAYSQVKRGATGPRDPLHAHRRHGRLSKYFRCSNSTERPERFPSLPTPPNTKARASKKKFASHPRQRFSRCKIAGLMN
mgnify:CR=1 FL=1